MLEQETWIFGEELRDADERRDVAGDGCSSVCEVSALPGSVVERTVALARKRQSLFG